MGQWPNGTIHGPTFTASHKSVFARMFKDMWEDFRDIREARSVAMLLIGAIIATVLATRYGLKKADQTWT